MTVMFAPEKVPMTISYAPLICGIIGALLVATIIGAALNTQKSRDKVVLTIAVVMMTSIITLSFVGVTITISSMEKAERTHESYTQARSFIAELTHTPVTSIHIDSTTSLPQSFTNNVCHVDVSRHSPQFHDVIVVKYRNCSLSY